MRLRLDLAYLGTGFEGWQAQEGSRPARTVQTEVETALLKLYGSKLRVAGAGRTDAGVHANGQVAHFDTPADGPVIPARGVQRGLNSVLPEDVRVTGVVEVAPDWHARFSATGKVYRYRLRRGEWLHPHGGLVEALAGEPLDVPSMRDAAARLVGRRDFAPFSLTGSDPGTTVRTLSRLSVEEEGSLLVITAVGEGFLRGMVRRLVGTLRDVGRGYVRSADALEKPGRTALARGLTLERVLYGSEWPGEPLE